MFLYASASSFLHYTINILLLCSKFLQCHTALLTIAGLFFIPSVTLESSLNQSIKVVIIDDELIHCFHDTHEAHHADLELCARCITAWIKCFYTLCFHDGHVSQIWANPRVNSIIEMAYIRKISDFCDSQNFIESIMLANNGNIIHLHIWK